MLCYNVKFYILSHPLYFRRVIAPATVSIVSHNVRACLIDINSLCFPPLRRGSTSFPVKIVDKGGTFFLPSPKMAKIRGRHNAVQRNNKRKGRNNNGKLRFSCESREMLAK